MSVAASIASLRQAVSNFSLLPPDNATGNFTKIVQRIPVKIVLEGGCAGWNTSCGYIGCPPDRHSRCTAECRTLNGVVEADRAKVEAHTMGLTNRALMARPANSRRQRYSLRHKALCKRL
jgi:hypothetical protein